MSESNAIVLVVGATGRTGRLVVAAAAEQGLQPRALARDTDRAREMLPAAEVVHGDLERPATLATAVRGVDAVVFAHGPNGDGRPNSYELIDYGGVAHVLREFQGQRPRIALMSTIFATRREHPFNEGGRALDWKLRAERLVRASGAPYTIVRPGWLDKTPPSDQALTVDQGDTGVGGVSREQVAQVLVRSLVTGTAEGKTFELFAAAGPPTGDWSALFAGLEPDRPGSLDGVKDTASLPLDQEPAHVRRDLDAVR
jgi:uncharacterized protein YbjT (DUF2867 family)